MEILKLMDQHGIMPDFDTYNTLLQNCINWGFLEEGKRVHEHMIKCGFKPVKFIGNQLLNLYAKLGSLEDACKVFDKMRKRNTVSWTSLIGVYAQNGCEEEAFRLYVEMLGEGKTTNQFTFGTVLSALAGLGGLQEGKIVHGQVVKTGFDSNVFVGTALLDFYFKCGRIEFACKVFETMPEKNMVSWNAMIAGYAKNNHIEDARQVFDRMPDRNPTSWSAIIAGYAQNGQGDEAISLFCQMQLEGLKPCCRIYASVVRACASLAALESGRQIHTHIIKSQSQLNVFVGSALVDMYAKCGITNDAWRVFEEIPLRNVVTWNAMIAGYVQNGFAGRALEVYEQMEQMNVKPDNVTFACVLYACSHLGFVDEGRHYFESMSRNHNIWPEHAHYVCMVDLLGRAGLLSEAEEFIHRMPILPSALVWLKLLTSCKTHGNVEIGQRAFFHIVELEPQNSSAYVLLTNIYAAAGNWDYASKLRKLMGDMEMKKETGFSWIGIKNKVHTFVASDRSHPLTEEIYAKLETLSEQIRENGYVPDTNFVLQDVDQHEKEFLVRHHSEKLAVAFGIISAPAGSPIRIVKNLRMCGDCHTVVKYISKVIGRQIAIRDTSRFHHFKDGVCSCKDFW
ncbi:pentatricopeptide repeat-containing protein At3g24000, mitochondrial isoform X2 [Cryptomeria japonica]|nr:pentatricopeptide repeat-containing protein At3g24000, mitochondrial isoform X2 [Cryptomeria japonica]